MPIQFRCSACDRMLGIARRKAGTVVKCPRCGADVQVPSLAGMAVATNGPIGAAPPIPRPTPASPVAPPRATNPPSSKANPKLDSMPLFERPDFETLLNPQLEKAKADPPRPPAPPVARREEPAVVEEADSVDVEMLPNTITLTRTKLTIAVAVVVLLLGLAFVTGWLLASALTKPAPTPKPVPMEG